LKLVFKTILHEKMIRPILYSAWFCPYAQRSWIALVHKKVDFEYREQNPYDKSPEWLSTNPRGLVPVLDYNGSVVIESNIINEFIDEVWNSDERPALLPPMNQPIQRARSRLWLDFIDKKLVPPAYQLLMKSHATLTEKQAAYQALTDQLEIFTAAMDSDGPFFMGKELGMVDISYAPFALRSFLFKEFFKFELPSEGAVWERFRLWSYEVKKHESVSATIQDEFKLLKAYSTYVPDFLHPDKLKKKKSE
jgi:glutathione S-transferase